MKKLILLLLTLSTAVFISCEEKGPKQRLHLCRVGISKEKMDRASA